MLMKAGYLGVLLLDNMPVQCVVNALMVLCQAKEPGALMWWRVIVMAEF
jgi:hypothetical protein